MEGKSIFSTSSLVGISVSLGSLILCQAQVYGFLRAPAMKIIVVDAVSGQPIKNAAVVTEWSKRVIFTLEPRAETYKRLESSTRDKGIVFVPKEKTMFSSAARGSRSLVMHPDYEVFDFIISKSEGDMKVGSEEIEIVVQLRSLKDKYSIAKPLRSHREDKIDGWVINGSSVEDWFPAELDDFLVGQGAIQFNYFEWAHKNDVKVDVDSLSKKWRSIARSENIEGRIRDVRKCCLEK